MDRSRKSPYLAVIDDETDIVYLFKEALSKINGIQVFGFSDPSLALAHFKRTTRVTESSSRIIKWNP